MQDEADLEATIEGEAASAERLFDLLAWALRQSHSPRPLQDQANWPPDLWVLDWPDTRKIALRDPLIYDLARHQAAADLRADPDRPLSAFQEAELLHHIADLLETAPPSDPPGAKQKGKRGIGLLVCDLRELMQLSNPWRLSIYSGPDLSLRNAPSDSAIAAAIADRLAVHPALADAPEAAKSAESIRGILAGCKRL
jgi:hypothetical protein